MPTYQYACTACGHDLEAVQSFSDDPLTECPECGGALRKVFGNVGVVFKGSGFYRNDSRGKSESSSTSPDATAAKKSDSSTAPKTESSSTSTGSSTPSPSGTSAA